MPQVPTLLPTVSPQGPATPEFQPRIAEGAFGETVARGFQQLGAGIGRGGDEIFNTALYLQNLQNQTEALDASSAYAEQSTRMRAEFHAQEGANAGPEALQKFQQQLDGLRSNLSSGMSNPRSRL